MPLLSLYGARMKIALLTVLAVGCLGFAQSDPTLPPELQQQIDRIRSQSHYSTHPAPASEAAKPAELADPADTLADVQDNAAILDGSEPVSMDDQGRTEQKLKDMVAAAQRRVDRTSAKLEQARQTDPSMVAELESELARRKETLDLVNQRAALVGEMIEMASAVVVRPNGARMVNAATLRYDGSGRLIRPAEFAQLSVSFARRFGKRIPVSAWGESMTHVELGFDHRGRIDVAVYPDSPEGLFIRAWLEKERVPYFAFRHAVFGRATGPHIHIGPGSYRFARASASLRGSSLGRTRQ